MKNHLISVSISEANILNLAAEIDRVILAGADIIYIDVPANKDHMQVSLGSAVRQAIREYGIKVPIGVNLRAGATEQAILAYAQSGVSCISISPSSTQDVEKTVELIAQYGCDAGLSLNTRDDLSAYGHCFQHLSFINYILEDEALVDGKFSDPVLNKITESRQLISKSRYDLRITALGDITPENAAGLAKAGIDKFIVGRSFFHAEDDYYTTIAKLRKAISAAVSSRV